MSSEEKMVAKITGSIIKVNGKKLKGGELTLFLVARNEQGAAVEMPFDSETGLTIKVNIKGGTRQIQHFAGNMRVKANHIESVVAREDVHIDSYRIGTLVARQTTLGNTREIGTCYAGCVGAHVNDQQRPITVRKSSRNPFDEEAPVEIGPRLRADVATVVGEN
jgi:hypothetical protein